MLKYVYSVSKNYDDNLNDNRYQTGLLWKYDHVYLSDNRVITEKRFSFFIKKIKNDLILEEALHELLSKNVDRIRSESLSKRNE